MATKLKISNPYCSFGFKRHWLKQSRRKTSDIIFKADGYCKFDSCSVLVTLSMPTPTQASSYVVNVSYSANVHHKPGDIQSRFIKGDARNTTMAHLSKFSPSYVRHQGLANMPSDVFHSGNRDGYGRSPRVLQQIASEGKRALRLDKSCLHSLLILQHEIIEEEEGDEPPTKVKGFIQHISAHPFYTIFYNEAGVRLYHCMASIIKNYNDRRI